MSSRLIGMLRQHPIWSDASDSALRALVADMREVNLRPGDTVLRAGDAARAIHLLVAGACRVFYPATGSTAEVTVKLFRAPAAFGDEESVLRTRWVETVEALTSGTVFVCDASAYFALLQREPRICFRQYWDVARRFGIAIETERAANMSSLVERVIAILLAYARQFGRETTRGVLVDHPLTQDDLARQCGSNKRSVVRVLARLYAEGTLARSGRLFLIPRLDLLLDTATGPVPEISFRSDERPWAETS